jgi:SAM-dependent methyltransferase
MASNFRDILTEAIEAGSLIELVLSKPMPGAAEGLQRLTARPVSVKGQALLQLASRVGSKEFHENLPAATALGRLTTSLGTTFAHAHVFTTASDYLFRFKSGGAIRVISSAPSKAPVSAAHDRGKRYLITEGTPCAFLAEIGVMTPAGRVHAAKYQKFRQINRFLELVEDVIDDLPEGQPLRVVDFGCGKSYLTFALHHLLTVIHQREVQLIGLDRNAEVIHDCQRIAGKLQCRGLEFRVGSITDVPVDNDVDLAVSLHACDTATDDALARAVQWRASVILAVPCCQHELAAKIGGHEPSAIARHGILHERLAALATDALRAEALEISGYKTQVIEFIDLEHTAKNLLIRAVRRHERDPRRADRIQAYQRLKDQLGLDQIYLEQVFGSEFRAAVSQAPSDRVVDATIIDS